MTTILLVTNNVAQDLCKKHIVYLVTFCFMTWKLTEQAYSGAWELNHRENGVEQYKFDTANLRRNFRAPLGSKKKKIPRN